MSVHSSQPTVCYKSLDFLGYPDCRVGDDGSVWHRIRSPRAKIEFSDVVKIRKMVATGKYTQVQIAKPLGINPSNISNILAGRSWTKGGQWRQVKGDPDKNGYTKVWLSHRGQKRKNWQVHRLVLEAFVGPRPQNSFGSHKNGSRKDNRLSNLCWCVYRTAADLPKLTFVAVHHPEKLEVLPDTTEERWRDVPGHEGLYRVSDWGRVKSLARRVNHRTGSRSVPEIILKPGDVGNGHLIVNLRKNSTGGPRLVHRLVMEAFQGPCPQGQCVLHRDDDPTNNRLENLYWGNEKQNAQDCIANGKKLVGEDNYNASLTNQQVREIRKLYATGQYTQTRLANYFNVSVVKIHKIVRHKQWKHI